MMELFVVPLIALVLLTLVPRGPAARILWTFAVILAGALVILSAQSEDNDPSNLGDATEAMFLGLLLGAMTLAALLRLIVHRPHDEDAPLDPPPTHPLRPVLLGVGVIAVVALCWFLFGVPLS